MNDPLSIVIVDEDRTSLALMDMLVRKLPSCSTRLFSDPQSFQNSLGSLDFDAAIFACRMPRLSGTELTRRMRADSRLAARPVMIVTDAHDASLSARAREAGASDVLTRPVEPTEFKARLAALLRPPEPLPPPPGGGLLALRPGGPACSIEEELVGALTRAAGYRDKEAPLHAARMARYCAIIAHHLGMPEEACAELRLAAPLHDIGKVGLSDGVLRNRGFLTPEQRRHMSRHTLIGHAILSAGRSRVMQLAAEIALSHHERWDGAGYPRGLRGEEIPLPGRIAAVADVFDALTSLRPYKRSWSMNVAFDYLNEKAGEQFDPRCVAAFQIGREEVQTVMALMPDLHAGMDADEDAGADAA